MRQTDDDKGTCDILYSMGTNRQTDRLSDVRIDWELFSRLVMACIYAYVYILMYMQFRFVWSCLSSMDPFPTTYNIYNLNCEYLIRFFFFVMPLVIIIIFLPLNSLCRHQTMLSLNLLYSGLAATSQNSRHRQHWSQHIAIVHKLIEFFFYLQNYNKLYNNNV